MKRKLVWRVLAALILLLCVAAVFWLHRPAQLPDPGQELCITLQWEIEGATMSPRTDSASLLIPDSAEEFSRLKELFYSLELRHSPFAKVEGNGVQMIVSFGLKAPEIYLWEGAQHISLEGKTLQVAGWKDAAARDAWFEKFYALLEQAEEYRVD